MRAIAFDGTANRATIVLTPSRLARLFGARDTHVELVRGKARPTSDEDWITAATRRELSSIPRGALIRDALDFRARPPPPPDARAVRIDIKPLVVERDGGCANKGCAR